MTFQESDVTVREWVTFTPHSTFEQAREQAAARLRADMKECEERFNALREKAREAYRERVSQALRAFDQELGEIALDAMAAEAAVIRHLDEVGRR